MRKRRLWHWWAIRISLSLALHVVGAEVTFFVVPAAGDYEAVSFPSSQYVYFASLREGQLLNGTGVILSGTDACTPSRSMVENKIVIVADESRCTLTEAYSQLADAGALAFVTVVPNTMIRQKLGSMSYRFESWTFNSVSYASSAPILGEIDPFFFDGGTTHAVQTWDSWKAAGKQGRLRVTVGPPFDTTFQSCYSGWLWIVMLRVTAPALAFFTAGTGLAVLVDQQQRLNGIWTTIHVVCLMEGLSAAFIGIALALGLYGPMAVPSYWLYPFLSLLGGVKATTQLLLVAFMREARRSIAFRCERENVWRLYRRRLLAFLIIVTALEMSRVRILADQQTDQRFSILFILSFFLSAVMINALFICEARVYIRPLRKHMLGTVHRRNGQRIKRVVSERALLTEVMYCESFATGL